MFSKQKENCLIDFNVLGIYVRLKKKKKRHNLACVSKDFNHNHK